MNLLQPPFTSPETRGTRMHRVTAEDQVGRMWHRRADHEFRISLRCEINGSVRGLEDGELTGFDTFGDSNAPGAQREPADRVVGGGLGTSRIRPQQFESFRVCVPPPDGLVAESVSRLDPPLIR